MRTGTKAPAMIRRERQLARPRSPKVQETMAESCTELARYCIRVRPAEKIEPMAMPARTMDWAEMVVSTVRRRMATVERREKMKALAATVKKSLTMMVVEVLVPAPKSTMATEAPKAAALERPRV